MLKLKYLIWVLLASQKALAHSGMSNFYVNGVDQGDAVCVRMNLNPDLWTDPVNDLTSTDMACGFNGTTGVNRVCAVPDGATLTFEWREVADAPGQGVIDISHMGPCSVYMKKVDSAIKDTAAGDGWFKIWDEGYDESTQQWCTKKLIDNGGFLSVDIPKGLVGGYYLVRPELLALHEVPQANNPQYYVGCGQIFLQSGGNLEPVSTVAIPGEVHLGDAADSFNIYDQPLKLPYQLPGPEVSTFQSGGNGGQTEQTEGLKPADCICESGSNFCGVEVPDYSDQAGCWNSSQACWNQVTDCYNTAPATGDTECRLFEAKCDAIQAQCPSGDSGPPDKGKDLSAPQATISIPAPLGPTVVGGSSMSSMESSGATPMSSATAVLYAADYSSVASTKASEAVTEAAVSPYAGLASAAVGEFCSQSSCTVTTTSTTRPFVTMVDDDAQTFTNAPTQDTGNAKHNRHHHQPHHYKRFQA